MYAGSWPRPWRTTATRRALASARPTRTGGAARCGFTDDLLDRVDRLELVDLAAPVLPVRRDAHVRAELVLGLVDA